ncbi:endoribonuclease CG2145-like [Macrobrachium rosenbergii]|uniref:endoribonuclease CG2145-like n=1 Tax=Macrobrachium rosenbergii TaxID=79674 RepID=UPI0034D5124E
MKAHFLLLCLLLEGMASEQLRGIPRLKDVTKRNRLEDRRRESCNDTTLDFSAVAETLIQLDVGGISLAINPKKSCSSRTDPYEEPLLVSQKSRLKDRDTVKELKKLLDEDLTKGQRHQDAFLKAIVNTEVMQCLEDYLTAKAGRNIVLRDVLDKYWFTKYPRGSTYSTGFGHVFQGEVKRRKVSGLHNWESLQKKGYRFCFKKFLELDHKGYVVETILKGNQLKTVFVETTPELEMALYTLCFSFRKSQKEHKCFLQERNFYITTFKNMQKEAIETAYPEIEFEGRERHSHRRRPRH